MTCVERVRESQQPLVAVTLCFVVGVLLGERFDLSPYLLLVGVGALSLFRRYRYILYLLSFVVGALWVGLYPAASLPREECYLRVCVETPQRATIRGFCREADDEWQRSSRRVAISGAEGVEMWGEELLVWGEVWRFNGRDYLSLDRSVVVERDYDRSYSARLSDVILKRIDKQGLTPRAEAVVEAMLLGRREGLSADLMRGYRESGAAHILAVSGLHVGVVAMILLLLLNPLALLWRGHIYRAVAVVVMIWIYAAIVGFTPSITRATMMFSTLMLASLSGRRYRSLTVLSAVVLLLTILDPWVIYDVGFQLSIVAILSIIFWALPLWQRFGARLGVWGELLLLPIWIGLCCSVALMPLLASTFGYFSIVGVLLNTILILSLYLILFLSIVHIISGITLLTPILELCVWVQSCSVEWASTGWRSAIELELTPLSALLLYLLYVLLTRAIYLRKK